MIDVIGTRIPIDCTKSDKKKFNDSRLEDKEKTQLEKNNRLRKEAVSRIYLLQHNENMECCKKRKAIANKIVIKARPRRDNANDIKKLLN